MQGERPVVLVCGSAASEGIPAYFCDCRVCREAAKRGGPDVRGRASYNFGGVLQIDFGPDSLQAFQRHRETMNAMRHVLVTHAHHDHLSPMELRYHGSNFCGTPANPGTLTIHGTKPTLKRIRSELHVSAGVAGEKVLSGMGLALAPVRPFRRVEMPDIGATALPLAADHDATLDPVVYIVTMGGRTVLFGNDTGLLPDASWRALEAYAAEGRPKFDVAILDNTGGFRPWRINHMGSEAVLETFARLEALGLVDAATKRVVNHFSHNADAMHDELLAFYRTHGIDVGYDGMEL